MKKEKKSLAISDNHIEYQGFIDCDGLVEPNSPTIHGFKKRLDSNNPQDHKRFHVTKLENSSTSKEQFLFIELAVMDYVTLRGIENRFGIKRENIPISIFKELLDNAADYIEFLALKSNHEFLPEIDVQIISKDDRITLIVANPDPDNYFTFDKVQSIFNFRNFASTKRSQYKISRGALGNGLKAVLGMSYALANGNYNYNNWTPLKIRTSNRLYSITLVVDKTNISTDIKRESLPDTPDISHTSIEIDIPTDSNSIVKGEIH